MTNEEKWTEKCDLCKKEKPVGAGWSYWDGWLSFLFCPDCEKNRDPECVKVMMTAESERIRKGREYWAKKGQDIV